MSFDPVANFVYSTVLTAPSPATSGTSLVLAPGTGVLFQANMNCVVWPSTGRPLGFNAEIIRIVAVVADTLTILRAQEGTTSRTILVGDQIANNVTAKTITDLEDAIGTGGTGSYASMAKYGWFP